MDSVTIKIRDRSLASHAPETGFATAHFRIFSKSSRSLWAYTRSFAPLKEIVALKEKYGAWLMIDEAHATGIVGKNGRGFAEECGASGGIEIQMGTLGKALGASGGYICGSRTLIDYLINRARSFIFSTAPVPAAAAAATAAVRYVQTDAGEKKRERLRKLVCELNSKLKIQNSKISAIIPLIIGDEQKALEIASGLRENKIFVPAIRYPTVARGSARLRVTLTAAHTSEDVEELCGALADLEKHRTLNTEH
jgi:7-keto-8-aminopelargonate synthetase-like enzyme